MKHIAILGSTGSIGVQSLDVISRFPDKFAVRGLTANSRTKDLQRQIDRFHPSMVAVMEENNAEILRRNGKNPEIYTGIEGLTAVVTQPEVDIVISALPGSAGLIPTLRAIEAGKTIALANKETLVMAGELLTEKARAHGVQILPVDSEHCAIHQCLGGQDISRVQRLILTASGGPFLNRRSDAFASISPQEALAHPTWNMGPKVTIDSATLMNKGFEVIEAHWLFGVPVSRIDVVIHPQSIIHSMVEFVDGAIIAQLGPPDMRMVIQYALTYPDRMGADWPRFDLTRPWDLTLIPPDQDKFPCLRLAYQAGQTGHMLPTVLSTADEIAVDAFLNERIGFVEIPAIIADTMIAHEKRRSSPADDALSLEAIVHADQWTRAYCGTRLYDRKTAVYDTTI